jgi:hypothetical protein
LNSVSNVLAPRPQLMFPFLPRYQPLPRTALHILPDMFSWVQRWPENHLIAVEIGSGVCVLVVWAHHVLGLTVLVKVHRHDAIDEVHFGTSPEVLVIDYYRHGTNTTVTLLSKSDVTAESERLTIKAGPDEDEITANSRAPIKGFAKTTIDKLAPYPGARGKILHEMASVTAAFTILISKHLSIIAGGNNFLPRTPSDGSSHESREAEYTGEIPDINDWKNFEDTAIDIPERNLLGVIGILFDGQKLDMNRVNEYVNFYAMKRLSWIQEPPKGIHAIIQEWDDEFSWRSLRSAALVLSMLALAFAHVLEFDDFSQLPFSLSLGVFYNSSLWDRLYLWDGLAAIRVPENVWFEVIARGMIGQTGGGDIRSACLVSENGWSVFLNTFGDPDPGFIGKSEILKVEYT